MIIVVLHCYASISFAIAVCKTCIVEYNKTNKNCPVCDTQINKTKPYLSMRLDKALQNMVYKLVPGLYTDEMERRKKFQEKHEPTKVPKAELERHFFFCDDKISMSLEYFDTEKSKNNNNENEADNGKQKNSNPNKRYLSCPGTVKIQHLMKFITMKYGLSSESFVVDVIYKGDIIPHDYTLIDVAYYYKWEKEAPMQFFYRIFKKNKVLLKRRKRKSLCEDKISDPKKAKTLEVPNNVPNAKSDNKINNKVNNKTNEPSKNGSSEKENDIKTSEKKSEEGGRTVKESSSTPPSLVDQTKKDTPKVSPKVSDKVSKESKPPMKGPPTLKPALDKDAEMKVDTSDEDEDDKPPSEKKLKIDLKPEVKNDKKIEPIKIPDLKKNLEKVAKESVVKSSNKVVKEQSKAENQIKSSPNANVKPCIPKLINPSGNANSNNKTKPNMLNNIVNNLTKKLTESGSPPPPVKPPASKPPSTLLGGQTTITKKDSKDPKSESKEKSVKDHRDQEKKPKGIPPATSVTLKTMSKSPSSTSTSSSSTNSASMSFSNSFKSKNNGSSSSPNSMMSNFVQPRPTNGLSPSSPTKNKTSTLSDLRTFRKESSSSSKSGSMPKSPITPSLTSRTLTLGNTKKSTSSSSSSSPTTTSSFSSTLTKPLPKPGEASSANNLLAAQAQISALASLGLTTGLTEAQKEYIKNLTAAANMSNLNNLASALFQQPLNHLSLPPSQQLPSNRLKLTMQSSKNSVHHPTNPLQMLPSLASHMAPESQWKSFSSHYSGHANQSSNGSPSSPKLSSLSKTLNQSIRNIPNPSLLTKQASEQQLLQVQRALAASQAAAAISSGSSLSQR